MRKILVFILLFLSVYANSFAGKRSARRAAQDNLVVKVDTVAKTQVVLPVDSVVLDAAQIILDQVPDDTVVTAEQSYVHDTITITAVGDVMIGSILPNESYIPPKGEAPKFFDEVKPFFENSDVVFCNVEGTFTDSPLGAKNCNDPKTCFKFGMPLEFAQIYKDAGFNVVSVANNHSGDFGEKGKENAKRLLDSLQINWAGFSEKPTAEFVVDGVKYGFCAFAPNRGTVQITDHAGACDLVKQLKQTCDIVIVSFHGGAEGSKYQHVPRKFENFLGQNRGNVYEFAHAVIDAGADIVLGHGPHVTRAVEIYKGKFIAYSMGNFATYSNVNISGVNGLAPIFRVKIDKLTHDFISAQIISTYQIKPPNKGPHIDPDNRVLKVIQKLTKEDIYDNLPVISDDGLITAPEGSSQVKELVVPDVPLMPQDSTNVGSNQ